MSGACDLHVRSFRKQSIGNSWDSLSHEWLGTRKNSIIFGSPVVPFYTAYIYTHLRDTHLSWKKFNQLSYLSPLRYLWEEINPITNITIECCAWIGCWETLEKRIFSHWGLKVQLGLVAGSRKLVEDKTQRCPLVAGTWRAQVHWIA